MLGPVAVLIGDRRQLIEHGVTQQKLAGKRVVVAGGDIRAQALQQQAGQPQAAAQFEDAQPLHGHAAQGLRQHFTGGPDLAEQRPGRRRNPRQLGQAVLVGKLLFIAQGTQVKILGTDAEGGIFDAVTRHGRLGLLKRTSHGCVEVRTDQQGAVRFHTASHQARTVVLYSPWQQARTIGGAG